MSERAEPPLFVGGYHVFFFFCPLLETLCTNSERNVVVSFVDSARVRSSFSQSFMALCDIYVMVGTHIWYCTIVMLAAFFR